MNLTSSLNLLLVIIELEYMASTTIPSSLSTDNYIQMSTQLYRDLALEARHIRLLRLSSSPHIDDIKCDLRLFRLRDRMRYKALSYAWGSAEDPGLICINGHEVHISRNLHDFLRVLRKRECQDWVWIDQLCIDQANPHEKGVQVSMMHEIYQLAHGTYVWLGLDPHHGLAHDYLNSWVQDRSWRLVRPKSYQQTWAKSHAYSELKRNIYWTRHWVAQEFVHSRAIIIIYGDEDIPWDSMSRICPWNSIIEKTVEEESNRMLGLLRFKYKCDTRTNSTVAQTFNEAILFARASSCEDPRDKIYGIQSVLPESVQIPVDYTQSRREVYLLAVETWYDVYESHRRTEDVLYFVQCVRLAGAMGLGNHALGQHAVECGHQLYADCLESQNQDKIWPYVEQVFDKKDLRPFLEQHLLNE